MTEDNKGLSKYVGDQVLVAVDGFRAFVPIPDDDNGQLTISERSAKYGQIATRDYQEFKQALKYADIEVV